MRGYGVTVPARMIMSFVQPVNEFWKTRS